MNTNQKNKPKYKLIVKNTSPDDAQGRIDLAFQILLKDLNYIKYEKLRKIF